MTFIVTLAHGSKLVRLCLLLILKAPQVKLLSVLICLSSVSRLSHWCSQKLILLIRVIIQLFIREYKLLKLLTPLLAWLTRGTIHHTHT